MDNYNNSDDAHVFHVSPAGNNVNGGLAQQYPVSLAADAKQTINGAITVAASGDIIVIHPGTYTEQLDLGTVSKNITLIGTDKHSCIITQAAGLAVILPNTFIKLYNLKITQTATGQCLHTPDDSEIEIYNCIFECAGNAALEVSGSWKAIIKDTYVFSEYDSVFMGVENIIDNCIIVTDGTYTGAGDARALRSQSSHDTKLLLRNSIIYAQPSYRKPVDKVAVLYESDRNLICLIGNPPANCAVSIKDSLLIADGYKPALAHADSYCSGNATVLSSINNAIIENSLLFARTDQNQGTTDATGLSNTEAQLANCRVVVSGTDVSLDFNATSAKIIQLLNTRYNPTQIGANITLHKVPSAVGQVMATNKMGF